MGWQDSNESTAVIPVPVTDPCPPPSGRSDNRRQAFGQRLAALEPVRPAAPGGRVSVRRRRPAAAGVTLSRHRFGFPDAGNDSVGTSGRTAYTTTAQAFGPGTNGPLLIVAELATGDSAAQVQRLASTLRAVPGVASTTPAQLNPAGNTAVFTVVPTTGPQGHDPENLVRHLRSTVLPAATAGTGLSVHVGGVTATAIDSTSNIIERIPLLIGGVLLLSMLMLLVAFRSVAVAIKAAVMSLLSVAAEYGVVGLVLQGGWFGRLFGIDNPTPLPALVPVLMFAVLFGLSMDYEVFLVARMREAWLRTGDNATSIVQGLAGTAGSFRLRRPSWSPCSPPSSAVTRWCSRSSASAWRPRS